MQQERQNARQELALLDKRHKTQDRIPQSQSSVTEGQGGEGSALPKEASSKFPAWVRLSYIFLLRNMRKSGQE